MSAELPNVGQWSIEDIKAHLPEKPKFYADIALTKLIFAYLAMQARAEAAERERDETEKVYRMNRDWIEDAKARIKELEAGLASQVSASQNLTKERDNLRSDLQTDQNRMAEKLREKDTELDQLRAQVAGLRSALEYVQFVHIEKMVKPIPGSEVTAWAFEHNAQHAKEALEKFGGVK